MRALTMDELEFVSGGSINMPAVGRDGTRYLDSGDNGPDEDEEYGEEMAESWGYTDGSGVVHVFANRGNTDAGSTTSFGYGLALGYAGGGGQEFIGVGIGIGGAISSGTPSMIRGTGDRLAYSWSIGAGGSVMLWWVNNDAKNAAFWGHAFNR
jgi:hypothetical protein